jgi:hypothetical protein
LPGHLPEQFDQLFPGKDQVFPVHHQTGASVIFATHRTTASRGEKVLLLLIVLLLLFGGGGGYYGYSRWGAGGGLGIVGTVVVIAVLLYFLGIIH